MPRLDLLLVEWGFAPSRAKSQELIRDGAVEIFLANTWKVQRQVSFEIKDPKREHLRIAPSLILKYVSRGGLKLEGAMRDFAIEVTRKRALDVGISTGGFTQCLLAHGVTSVVGIDVGTDQVAESLLHEARVSIFEKTHVRDLKNRPDFLRQTPFDIVVMDVSFISCLKVVPEILPYLVEGGELLILVKPQFELGREALDKRGVVKDVGLYQGLQVKICEGLKALGIGIQGYGPSDLKGQDGNTEFFVYGRRRVSAGFD